MLTSRQVKEFFSSAIYEEYKRILRSRLSLHRQVSGTPGFPLTETEFVRGRIQEVLDITNIPTEWLAELEAIEQQTIDERIEDNARK